MRSKLTTGTSHEQYSIFLIDLNTTNLLIVQIPVNHLMGDNYGFTTVSHQQ